MAQARAHIAPHVSLVAMGLATAILPSLWLLMSYTYLFVVPLLAGIACAVVGCLSPLLAMNRRTANILLALCFAAGAAPVALALYYELPGRPIKIVLPVGYRSHFSIIKNRATGQDLEVKDGAYVFEIPARGVLVVKDDSPFYSWHEEIFVYADGQPATVEPCGTIPGRMTRGPYRGFSNTDYDGTTHCWKVVIPLRGRLARPLRKAADPSIKIAPVTVLCGP